MSLLFRTARKTALQVQILLWRKMLKVQIIWSYFKLKLAITNKLDVISRVVCSTNICVKKLEDY